MARKKMHNSWTPGPLAAMSILALAGCDMSANAGKSESAGQNEPDRPAANPLKNAYFGDLHIHSRNSFDAYIFNVRTTPEDAYRFGLGEEVMHPAGYPIKLAGPPLDFMAVTDHAAYLGHLPKMDTPGTKLSMLDIAKDMFSSDNNKILAAFQLVGGSVRSGKPLEGVYNPEVTKSTWAETIAAANKYYKPGKFTTFTGYEYTAVRATRTGEGFGGANLHRNVIYRGEAPNRPFSTLDSTNPEKLWEWMDKEREKGFEAIAIPHNSNVSDGEMFALSTYDRNPLSPQYAEQRLRNEPIVEITQVKGTSETHPALSPNDEWADFGIYDKLLSSADTSKTISGDYIRQAVGEGLLLKEKLKTNPFQFGFIGSSDTHVVGGSFDEKNFWSKAGLIDSTAERRGSIPPHGAKSWEGITLDPNADLWFSRWGASGYAAVWAEENTRESIFAAMRRKETYATTGTRIKVRFFAGTQLPDNIDNTHNAIEIGYTKGVPMGGHLNVNSNETPNFFVWAERDPQGAPLQRVQIVKLWVENGKSHEKLFDIVCSDGLKPSTQTRRCDDNGAKVDLSDCSISTDKGAPTLSTTWKDPAWKIGQRAAYYVRVLENPTCRWSTWDAINNGTPPNPKLKTTIQERAWTSPIWVGI